MAQTEAQKVESEDEGRYYGAEQVAATYAKAFLSAADAAQQADALVEEFGEFISQVLDRVPGLEEVLGSRLVSSEEKSALLERAVGKQASPLLMNFLRVLAAHGRLDILRPIRAALRAELDQLRNRIRVRVVAAAPVDPETAERLRQGVQRRFDAEPILEMRVDPALIGGVLLRIGDTVYDGSVSSQLEAMRERMINRSVHEIQTRRDRFSSAT